MALLSRPLHAGSSQRLVGVHARRTTCESYAPPRTACKRCHAAAGGEIAPGLARAAATAERRRAAVLRRVVADAGGVDDAHVRRGDVPLQERVAALAVGGVRGRRGRDDAGARAATARATAAARRLRPVGRRRRRVLRVALVRPRVAAAPELPGARHAQVVQGHPRRRRRAAPHGPTARTGAPLWPAAARLRARARRAPRRHAPAKYIGVAAMCVGASAFFLLHETAGGARRTTPAGVALVACALVSDGASVARSPASVARSDRAGAGIYGGYQTKLVARCDSEWVLMFYMNAWQALLSACACAAAGGELGAAAAFVSAHPRVARDLALFNVSKALGTLCVYRLLRESGTIVVATVTTLRKVLSVLLSVAYFGHAVGAAQWAALALVFLHAYVGGAIAAVLRVGSD